MLCCLLTKVLQPASSAAMGEAGFNLFDFVHYRDFLGHLKQTHWVARGRPLTLDRISAKLGYRSPRLLGMVLKGQRLPSQEFTDRLATHLRLNASQKRYLQLLIRYERLKAKNKDTQSIIEEIRELLPGTHYDLELENHAFHYVADWYTLVIRQLQNLKGIQWNPATIRNLLRNKLSTAQVSQAIDTLKKLKLLGDDASENLISKQDIPSAAIKRHHEEMSARAMEALHEQPVEDREFTALTIAFKQDEVDEAKQFIRSFRDQFNKRFTSTEADAIYQMNIHFFSHTTQKEKGHA